MKQNYIPVKFWNATACWNPVSITKHELNPRDMRFLVTYRTRGSVTRYEVRERWCSTLTEAKAVASEVR